MSRRAWQAGTAFAAALVLVATACGGDSGDGAEADAETPTTTHDHAATGPGPGAHEHETAIEVDSEDRCDLAFNTSAFNNSTTLVATPLAHHDGSDMRVDFTVQEWAATFVDPRLGVAPGVIAAGYDSNPALKDLVLSGTFTHSISPDPWVPMTDPEECEKLADELQRARNVAERYPTVAEAVAAGYTPGSIYAPGQGAHFTKMAAIDGTFDPDEPELLMYDGSDPTSELMGLSYYLFVTDGLPNSVGFTGGSDIWHVHQTLCHNSDGVAVGQQECDAGRATRVEGAGGWMTHAWVVPGCESDWGVFSGANPAVKYIPSAETPFASGCNTGASVTDDLDFADGGDGPRIT